MTLTEKEIKRMLRYHIKRKLKILGGHGQITIRRLGKSLFAKNGKGYKYKNDLPNVAERQVIYRIATELCEEYGGKRISDAYCRHKGRGVKVARVYQF